MYEKTDRYKEKTTLQSSSEFKFDLVDGILDELEISITPKVLRLEKRITLSGSLIEPFPLIYTRQPVEASTLFNELPLGPRSRPTKLN